jgi:ArsR family metal-binding transcriptional regulator
MLLSGYTKQIFRPECNPSFQSVHCRAQLDTDIACALPYLNAVLGGTQYFQDPPAVLFHHHGRIIKVGAREIAINALEDEAEAERVLTWLVGEINGAWERRESIAPSTESRSRPQLLEILKLLPRTNCQRCAQPTCMVFAARIAEGVKSPQQCPEMAPDQLARLTRYLSGFTFVD